MFFDDRLSTVLRQETPTEIAKRTQFRQLLDILGNRKFGPVGGRDRSLVAAAWLRMDALGRSIPASERAAMIREPSWRFRSADLAAHLADFEPEVASAALNRAELTAEDWSALIPRLPVRARGFLRLRRDLPADTEALLDRLGVHDRGLPSPGPTDADDTGDAPFMLQTPEEEEEPLELHVEAPLEDELGDNIEVPTPPISPPPEPAPKPEPADATETGRSEISALVERIAQFTRAREAGESEDLTDSERSPRLPLGEVETAHHKRVTGFAFSADTNGRIDWAEADVAPMVIGTRLVAPAVLGGPHRESDLERAFMGRQPILGLATELHGAAAIAGEWNLDAEPSFAYDGHFTGYVGRFRRPAALDDEADEQSAQEADRIRQLLHELRTPVTAVQGYAEVIQQQLFGPAPHEYRALAAAIAADAAHILAGFEELDRLSRLEIGAIGMEPGETDIAALIRQTDAQLSKVLTPRMAGISLDVRAEEPLTVSLDTEEAELMIWRFMATLAGACSAGETIEAELIEREGAATLTCDLPRTLLEEEDIFIADNQPIGSAINAGPFGAGFALRLARAEARAAGGALAQDEGRIALTIPLVPSEPAAETTVEATSQTGEPPLTPA